MIAAFAAKSLTGTVLQAAMSVNGIVAGPMLGLFTLGMFCPWVGSVPATVAFLTSVLSSSLMYLFNNPTQIFQKLLPGKFETTVPERLKTIEKNDGLELANHGHLMNQKSIGNSIGLLPKKLIEE